MKDLATGKEIPQDVFEAARYSYARGRTPDQDGTPAQIFLSGFVAFCHNRPESHTSEYYASFHLRNVEVHQPGAG